MSAREQYNELRSWEKGRKQDISGDFARSNKDWLKNFGNDSLSYKVENAQQASIYWAQNEGKMSHGYPATFWLQFGLLYAAGVYTARQQGLIRRNVFFTRFWRFHYFDWIGYIRRSVVYAWAGGLVAGTILFGSPDLAVRRAINRYHYWFTLEKIDHECKTGLIIPKLN